VYQYLEKNNYTISEVSGTSMGAIVAAGIATGKSFAELDNIIAKEL